MARTKAQLTDNCSQSYGACCANAGQDGYKQREDSLAMIPFLNTLCH